MVTAESPDQKTAQYRLALRLDQKRRIEAIASETGCTVEELVTEVLDDWLNSFEKAAASIAMNCDGPSEASVAGSTRRARNQ